MIGEAVALDLRPARVPSRALALALDLLIMLALLVLLLGGTAFLGADVDGALTAALAIGIGVVVLVGWPTAWETLSRGRSPGKYALGLRVVRDDGGPVRFRHALVRALAGLVVDFGILSAFTGVIALVVSASSERGKRLGDLMAGTIVLRERVPRDTVAGPPTVPPPLLGWAPQLQLAALPDDLALAARQFLARADRLDPAARLRLGGQLAADVAGRVAPAPPSGTPPEAFLAGVLGERYRRESQRFTAGAAGPGGSGGGPGGPHGTVGAPSPAGPPPPAPGGSSAPPSPGGFAPPG